MKTFKQGAKKIELYLRKAKQMVRMFQEVEIQKISRIENYRVDMLVRIVATTYPKLPKSVPMEVKISPSIK